MSLADIVVPSEEIDVLGTKVTLHPLDLESFVKLIRDDRDTLASLYEASGITWDNVAIAAPNFAARMIAYSAHEPGAWQAVRKWPLGCKIKAMEAVWRLTNMTADDLGNVISALVPYAIQVYAGLKGASKKTEEVKVDAEAARRLLEEEFAAARDSSDTSEESRAPSRS